MCENVIFGFFFGGLTFKILTIALWSESFLVVIILVYSQLLVNCVVSVSLSIKKWGYGKSVTEVLRT